MHFRIADTFTASLARLTGAEQKAVKTTAFDLQLDLTSPGLRFHKLDRSRDPNFCSVRVNDDIRLIVHRTADGILLCYVDHHDPAYTWAERRRIERHPTTGAAQLVELPERVERDFVVAIVPPQPESKPLLFAGIDDDTLLQYGVPDEWLGEVRRADEDSLFEVAQHLPQEAAEALLSLATGGTPEVSVIAGPPAGAVASIDRAAFLAANNPFNHPDAQRRSGRLPMWRNWNERSTTHGRGGRFFCIRRSVAWSSANTAAQPAYRVPLGPERLSWRCIGRLSWPDADLTLASC